MKYTSGKRTHLELVFFNQEATDTWTNKPITIVGKDFRGMKALSSNKSFLSIALSGIPLGSRKENTEQIKDLFSKFGKVVVIKPKLWEGTSICSDKWAVTFDTSDLQDISTLTNSLPRTISIGQDKVFVTWRMAPAYCTFCKKNGHRRSDCNELLNANTLLDQQPQSPTAPSHTTTHKGKERLTDPEPDTTDLPPVAEAQPQAEADTLPPPATLSPEQVNPTPEQEAEPPFTLVENKRKKKLTTHNNPKYPPKDHGTWSKPTSTL
jgi:hypothetical protein